MKRESTFNFSGDDILKDIIDQIVNIANPDKIILFGSRATGTHREDSDYDICVLKKNIKKRRKLAQRIYMKLDILASVDVIVNTPARFSEIKESPFFIYRDIDKHGKVLYEKE